MILGIYGFGKMGSAIYKIAKSYQDFSDILIYKQEDSIENFISKADLILDFSINSATAHLLNNMIEAKASNSVVVGTTNLSNNLTNSINNLSDRVPVMVAPNVSLGANLLAKFASEASKILGKKYDIDIIERHHNLKVDSPSGTALLIGNAVANEVDLKIELNSATTPRENVMNIHSIRSGSIAGEHEVIFCSSDDEFIIKHKIYNRDLLAKNALEIGIWLKKQKPGLYNIDEFLGI
ncbi:MAG: 4-hydroxy-tetrahydrodipicolinate reductase [Rickettsiaceae bacterium]|nr:4-hydroxy-tetrahydrodipicolinate reductase [Rickettsiaceae bacterium]